MNEESHVVIIGGGLAGLTAAIHLANQNVPVTLIEKDTLPRHKVCGEYISNEILPYFNYLDIAIEKLEPVKISRFHISTQHGGLITSRLPLGGFGVSRYALDHYLYQIAKEKGVNLIHDEVNDVQFSEDRFCIRTITQKSLRARFVLGAFGKRSTVDRTLNRDFMNKKSSWLAVKSHYHADFESDLVALHNFEGGYCGISKVENDKVNVCYLVNYKTFKKYKDIQVFQEEVMCQNPRLHSFFSQARPIFKKPITIAQVNFDKKQPVFNHIFMIGDAAGLIHPLCGNGMAMAIQSAQIISKLIVNEYTGDEVPRVTLEKLYRSEWERVFQKRLRTGRALQHILLHSKSQQFARYIALAVPSIVPRIIRQTHGKPLVC